MGSDNNRTAIRVFILWGMALWFLGGWMTAMMMYEPAMESGSLEFKKQLGGEWTTIFVKHTAAWITGGVLMGFLTLLIYTHRPSHEYSIPMPNIMGMPGSPKTMAEVNSILPMMFVGVVILLLLSWIIPPLCHSKLLIPRPLANRLVMGCLISIPTVVPILPFSLKRMTVLYKRGEVF